MSKSDNYKQLFNQQFLMGPNSVRLLDEMLEKTPMEEGLEVLDLGCGKGLTSLYLAKEINAHVFATDLWISASENYENFKTWGIDNRIVPIHADANDLPYSNEYFDAIVCIDSFHYFANQKGFLQKKILPLLKKKGKAIIVVPGLKSEIHGDEPQLMKDWIDDEDNEYEFYHSREWWKNFFGEGEEFEIEQELDLDNFGIAWDDWFLSKHPLSIRDCEFFEKGVNKYLASVGFVIRKN